MKIFASNVLPLPAYRRSLSGIWKTAQVEASWAKNDLEFPKGIKKIESTFMPFLRLTYSERVKIFFWIYGILGLSLLCLERKYRLGTREDVITKIGNIRTNYLSTKQSLLNTFVFLGEDKLSHTRPSFKKTFAKKVLKV